MKRVLLLTAALALTSTIAPAFAATAVTVPAHTVVKLVSDSAVTSSAGYQPGFEIDLHVAEPVVVRGWIVIPEGAQAVGHLVESGVDPHVGIFSTWAGGKSFTYALDYVVDSDGRKIKLDPTVTPAPSANGAVSGRPPGSAGLGIITLGTPIQGTVDHDVQVNATEKDTSNGGYAQ